MSHGDFRRSAACRRLCLSARTLEYFGSRRGRSSMPSGSRRKYQGRELIRFEAETQQEAIHSGKAATWRFMRERSIWAFARDGIIREADEPVDAISVELWGPGMESPVLIIQTYEPFAKKRHFKVRGRSRLIVDGQLVSDVNADLALKVGRQGLDSHSSVAPLLRQWCVTTGT
jgi:hypothetical protein